MSSGEHTTFLQSAPAFELLRPAADEQALPLGGGSCAYLNLLLEVSNCAVHVKKYSGSASAREHDMRAPVPSTQAEYQMQSTLFLDVVVLQGPACVACQHAAWCQDQALARFVVCCMLTTQLHAREHEALHAQRDALLVLDLLLHVIDRGARLDVEGDGLAGEGLDEYLHAAAQTEHEVQGRLILL